MSIRILILAVLQFNTCKQNECNDQCDLEKRSDIIKVEDLNESEDAK